MRKTIIALSVIGFGIAGLTGAGLPTQAGAQEVKGPKVTWRLSLWGKRRAFTEGLEYISKTASEKTDGNFQIKLFYGEQLSKSKENLDGISVGAFEAALFCAAYHPGKNRPLNVLDLPFLPLGALHLGRLPLGLLPLGLPPLGLLPLGLLPPSGRRSLSRGSLSRGSLSRGSLSRGSLIRGSPGGTLSAGCGVSVSSVMKKPKKSWF